MVGALMAKSLRKVKWHDLAPAKTAFMTVMIMPLTYSLAYGLLAGMMTWLIMQIVFFLLEKCRIERPSFDDCEENRITQFIHPHPSRALISDDDSDGDMWREKEVGFVSS